MITPPQPGAYELGFRMSRRTGQSAPDVKVWVDDKLVITPELSGINPGNAANCIAGNCTQSTKPIMADLRRHKAA